MINTVFKENGLGYIAKAAENFPADYAAFRAALLSGLLYLDLGLNTDGTGTDVIGTPLSAENLLSTATAERIGMTPAATVDDAINYLITALSENDPARPYLMQIINYISTNNPLYFEGGLLADSFAANNFSQLNNWTYSTGRISASSGAQNYYYDKYEVDETDAYYEVGGSSTSSFSGQGTYSFTAYDDYTFSASSGFSATGASRTHYVSYSGETSASGYSASPTSLTYISAWGDGDIDGYRGTVTITNATYHPAQTSRGSLVQSNVIAGANTYPQNGIQGGYWWVRKGTAGGTTAEAITNAYTLDSAKSKAMACGIYSSGVTLYVSLDDGSHWTEAVPGEWVDCTPGTKLKIKISGEISGTLTCDGVGAVTK